MVNGKTVLITGSTDGVGKLVARRLAAEGARLLLHGRDPGKGAQVLDEIRAQTCNQSLEYFNADFVSLEEVRRMAAAVLARHAHIDILINNAGIGGGTHGTPVLSTGAPTVAEHPAEDLEKSKDGYELRFAVNHLAGFLLTNMLLPALQRSDAPRIVAVSSIGQSPVDFDDVMLTSGQDGWHAYRQSKFAQIMFSFDLAERLRDIGATAVALHPATFMDTKLVLDAGLTPKTSVEEGADAIIRAATDPGLAGQMELFFNGQTPMRARDEQAYDPAARRRLWELSARLTGLAS